MASTNTNTTTVQQQIDPWLRPYYGGLLGGAEGWMRSPYQPYGAQRVAGLSPMEIAAQRGIAAMGQANQGYKDLSSTLEGYGNIQSWPGADHQAYMSPYQQNVTDIQAREVQKMGQRQLGDMGSQAATAGAFGGARHGLLESGIMQGMRQQIGDITQQGQRDAYTSAMGQFNADRDARFRGLGGQADVAMQRQNMGLGMMDVMNQYGQQHRQLNQANLDVGYQDYLRQQGMPEQRMQFMSGILGGFPTSGQTDYYTYRPSPSLGNSLLGVGLGAAAMNRNTQPYGARGYA